MNKKIGILAGMEWDHFPVALIQRINQVQGFQAELAKIDATPENFTKKYDVLVDRISHEVPFYRFHLKAAMLAGTYVINDPLWFSADDKFFGFSLANRIGVTVPRTVMLPQREYIPAIDPNRSLNNLVYPLDWEGIARYVGFPAICKPADGGGWRNVNRVNNMDELMSVYNNSGQLVLTMQQFIDFDDYVRCLVIGREHVRMIRYSVKTRSYLPEKNFLPAALEARITDSARELNRALGYDMNSVEFAIKDGVPYAIDFTNPAPDMYPHHILPDNYEWCLEKMSELCITAAREGRQNDVNHSWQRYLEKKTSHPAASAAAPRATAVNAVATAR